MSLDPLIGRQLANFLIERPLGRGGMAQVYYGRDVKLDRPVALKVIDGRYRGNPAYAERFVREARTVATWRHENVIQIYYADDEEELYYFVMEYIDGADLGQVIAGYAADEKLISYNEVVRLGRAIAHALDYAHSHGVIHRDVKPSNVMVAHSGRVVLTDFGLAMAVEQGSLGEVFGSSHYIAPEQAHRSADAVPQSDLYSLGVILFEMLTGTVPFNDPSPTAVALQHVTLDPPRPRDLNAMLSFEVEAVLLKALSKSVAHRYQTGEALISALAEALAVDEADEAEWTKPSPPIAHKRIDQPPGQIDEMISPALPAFPPDEFATLEIAPAGLAQFNSAKAAPTKDLPSPERANPAQDEMAWPEGTPTLPIPDTAEVKVSAPSKTAVKTQDELIGQQLDEYQLEALLGHGGMARVYRGRDIRLNRAVAIKVIDTPFQTDSDYLMRFEREAQAIAQLEHPNVVTVYRFGEAEGLLYLAMRYVEGLGLDSMLATYRDREKFIAAQEASRIIREVCSALDYAHEKGVIHRDVKPSNIMLDRNNHVVLTDFGLALLTEVGTRGEIFGSPHYVAPEQAVSSAGALPQSDLYAVGVIMYQMFTGQLPFLGEKALDIAKQHLTQSPPSPRAARPELSPALEAVILKTLAKKPEDRYPSGATLADALDEALSPTAVVVSALTPASAPTLPIEPVLATPSSPTQVLSGSEPQPAEPPPAAEPVETTSVSPESVTGGWINQISQNIPVLWIYAGVVLFLIATIVYLALIAF